VSDLQDAGLQRFLRVYDPAQVIFREGDPGDVMFVVQNGEVEIHRDVTSQSEPLARLSAGEIFGEMALVDQSPRSATAVASSRGAKVLAIDSAHFVYLVGQQPAFALVVLEVMASRLRSINQRWETAR